MPELAEDRMPRWVPRALGLAAVGYIATRFLIFAMGQLRGLLVSLLISLFLSFALEPAVKFLSSHGWRRGAASAAVLLGTVLLVVGFVAATLPPLISQAGRLAQNFPTYLDRASELAKRWFDVDISTAQLADAFRQYGETLTRTATGLAGRLFGIGTRLLGFVFQGLTILLFTFYLVADGPRLRRSLLSVLKPERQKEVLRIWEIAIEKTGGYVYSRLLLAAASALFAWVLFVVLVVPYPVALAIWVGLFSQFIPAVGTYLAASVPVVVGLFQSTFTGLWVALGLAVYQQVENYFLSPRITARTMQLHPALAFGSAAAGGGIMGPVGAIIAIPTAAILQAFISTYLERHRVVESSLTAEPTEDSSPD